MFVGDVVDVGSVTKAPQADRFEGHVGIISEGSASPECVIARYKCATASLYHLHVHPNKYPIFAIIHP